jgi:Zn-dependent protease with chaperone function
MKEQRQQALAIGALALPNLVVRSIATLTLLYGMLSLLLITVVEAGFATPSMALVIGVGFAVLQFVIGPWIMDLSLRWLYTMRWVAPDELPPRLHEFVQRVCDQHKMKFPSFGIIDDGAPQAFTYGHHPNNARVVISRGLMELLEPSELDAVVAHELGHAYHWDMALMTLANLVPLLLFYAYRVGLRVAAGKGEKTKAPAWAVAVGAYILYIVSEYLVLWFSRTREYHADRFAGATTGNPNALAMALVKIAYGLAAQDSHDAEAAEAGEGDKEKKVAHHAPAGTGAMSALNIFDRRGAVGLVMSSASTATADEKTAPTIDMERVKSAMQWDLWNPWAGLYEMNSTHPLVAKRLEYLSDQASALGQKPAVVFDRAKPESYWDDFAIDVSIWMLPYVGMLLGLGVWGACIAANQPQKFGIAAFLALLGAGTLLKTLAKYRGKIFPQMNVAALMGHVKVSPVRPVPATVTGKIIGKGVPGLIYSNNFVIRDPSGILFLNYQQPLNIWNFLYGWLKAGKLQGHDIRAIGWFRRAPVPYFEILRFETLDDNQSRSCYAYHAALLLSVALMLAGLGFAMFG